jgi:hypothetical protein
LPYCDYDCFRGREMVPWSFAAFDNFALMGLQLAEDFQRMLLDAYAK